MKTNQNESPFGEVIYSYTRKQAIADGVQVEVTKTAQEAGIKFPMFLTRAVFDKFVAVPEGVTGQDEAGRLWDVVWMTRFGIIRGPPRLRPQAGRRRRPSRHFLGRCLTMRHCKLQRVLLYPVTKTA